MDDFFILFFILTKMDDLCIGGYLSFIYFYNKSATWHYVDIKIMLQLYNMNVWAYVHWVYISWD